jgi:hypothetical protein
MCYLGIGPTLDKSNHLIKSECSMIFVLLTVLVLAAEDLIQNSSIHYSQWNLDSFIGHACTKNQASQNTWACPWTWISLKDCRAALELNGSRKPLVAS